MSFIQDDREIENRDKLEEEHEAPLRDQIPEKLRDNLEELDIASKIKSVWYSGNSERSEWLSRQEEYLHGWDEFLSRDGDTEEGPFEGASNIHLPVQFTIAKTMAGRLMQALFGVEPPFNVKPREQADVKRAEFIDALMSWTLRDYINYNEGIRQEVWDWVWSGVTTGVGIMKARWDRQFRRFQDVEIIQEVNDNPEVPGIAETLEIKEETVNRTIKTFDGPVVENIDPEDVLIIGGKGDIQKADAVIHRQYLTASELRTLADQKIFNEDSVEEVIESGQDHKSGSLASSREQISRWKSGQSELDTETDLDRYEIWETYMTVDADQDGIDEEVVVWIHERTGEILRATYLHRIHQSGKRPFFKWDFFRRTNQTYGIGLVEVMHPYATEIDALHNQGIDAGTIANMPFFFYRANSTLDPERISFQPGDGIPLDDPANDVVFPRIPQGSNFYLQQEEFLNQKIQAMTGINDINLGVLGAQGAARTATGARAVVSEANANIDIHLQNLAYAWRGCLNFIFQMLQQRIPEGLGFRVTGKHGQDYFGQIRSRDEISGKFDFEISENSANSNRQIQQQTAQLVLQEVAQNPLLIQLGLVTPVELYEAYKNRFQSLGIKNWSNFLKKPQGQKIPTVQEEINMILQGINVDIQMNMDHQLFIEAATAILRSDDAMAQYDQQAAARLQIQMERHQQMMQALEQMRAQQQVTAQANRNATGTQGEQEQATSPGRGAFDVQQGEQGSNQST